MSVSHYDLIVCGTGFASSFFLQGLLARKPGLKILVLERGGREPYEDMLAKRRVSPVDNAKLFKTAGMPPDKKTWLFTVALGGGSSCWWGQTPRMLPDDFRLKSRYGVGYDWPIGYDDLADYYDRAETLIGVAGPATVPYPKPKPYPQGPHPLSSFDNKMQSLLGPEVWVTGVTARSSTGTSRRGKCCANGICGLCPMDAKFRVMNELAPLYDSTPAIELHLNAEVLAVDVQAGTAKGVVWREDGRERRASADLVFLGLNALFNPPVLMASGDKHPLTGKRLAEQVSIKCMADFADLADFDGGTHITGLGYMYYNGEHRRNQGAVLVEHYNAPPLLRAEKGKWRNRAVFKLVAENLPDDANRVEAGTPPVARYVGHSEYGKRALADAKTRFTALVAKAGSVEDISFSDYDETEGHIQGTTVMARSREEGVIDADLRHYDIKNLLVGGSGAFPSNPPANPSLTIAALSLRAADRLMS